jgi:hypothetical protein
MDQPVLPVNKANISMPQQELVNAFHPELFLMVTVDALTIYHTIQHQTDVSVVEISKL